MLIIHNLIAVVIIIIISVKTIIFIIKFTIYIFNKFNKNKWY